MRWHFSQGDNKYLDACLYKYYYNGSKVAEKVKTTIMISFITLS